MEIRYSLPPVDLSKQDIEWLEREILDLFSTPEPTLKSYAISVSVGKGSDKIDVEETKVDLLLRSAFLRKVVNRLQFSFSARYKTPPENEYRRVTLTFETNSRTEIRLEGVETWVHLARDRLSTYLAGKANHNQWLRRGAAVLIWALPFVAFLLLGFLRPIDVNCNSVYFLAAFFWSLFGLIISPRIADAMYPLSNLTLDPEVKRPWFTTWAHQLLGALVISAIAGVLVALFIR